MSEVTKDSGGAELKALNHATEDNSCKILVTLFNN